ncbi:7-cyano-7-deazaguanine synthase QueC [Desulfurispirillum indicum]|uniref:7-cyano-7-deazaguanine synthase n=1 Tax=Desulfurispirillum indicum (strain ATCC BAA-1389 / DSM 22839 / S5) TaxID=653733 RepID=E6W4G1_DESIS|nr:7-cyano-7-deazaguanine synthase QueC [Desulfurispirillum indicum]ADU65935.1 exsB protein [Desulfurispirillum indicum S5]UCZ57869.1 7-cyano-7-deazaguanine synthase QueC [Desulfurispirillum indicum]
MKPSAVALLSGGMDSTCALLKYLHDGGVVRHALTMAYGQLAQEKEIAAAAAICDHLGIPHETVELPFLARLSNSSLNRGTIPENIDINDTRQSEQSARSVWVPNRNGLFINIAAVFAESMGCQHIITGFNVEEAQTFPDNSRDFLMAANGALHFSTLDTLFVVSGTIDMDKKEIAGYLMRNAFPMELIWSCYKGEEVPCGTCESCLRMKRAIEEAQ